MRRSLLAASLVGSLAIPAAVFAAGVGNNWTGAYATAQAGVNNSSANGVSSATGVTLGGVYGYNYTVNPHFVVGGDVYLEWNQESDHDIHGPGYSGSASFGTNAYGFDALFGFPAGDAGNLLPYVKLGYGGAHGTSDLSGNANAFRYGVGIEWRMSQANGIDFQYTHQDFGSDNAGLTNNNLTVGYTWHFD